jgi:hypothetical protein
LIREVVASCGGLSRNELANTVCELLDWRRSNGGLKAIECRELLETLEGRGLVELPAQRATKPRGARTRVRSTGWQEQAIAGDLWQLGEVSVDLVGTAAQRDLWRELIERYHYLGHRVPFGAHLRYLIRVSEPRGGVVGCIQFSSAAWRLAARDRWIGWTDTQRAANLQQVICNSRFLVLPSVQVRNLASKALAVALRAVAREWPRHYRVRPALVETLVDQERFSGGCYRAANWVEVGVSSGRGRMDREHRRHGAAPKRVFLYPLNRCWREQLCGQ